MTETEAGSLPPQDRQAERSVLGGCLRWNAAIDDAVQHIGVNDFYVDAHRKIFEAMLYLHNAGKPADSVTVADLLHQRKQIDDAGSYPYLAELWDAVSSGAHVEYHAKIVRAKSLLRGLAHASSETLRDVHQPTGPAEEVLEAAERRIFELSQSGTIGTTHELPKVLSECLDLLDKRLANKGGASGIPTGFIDLDELLSGLHDGELIIIAARPSVGKTVTAGCLARNVVQQGFPVLFVSLEQSRHELVERLLCCEAKINSHHVRKGLLTQEEMDRIDVAYDRCVKHKLFINDTPGLTAMRIASEARRMKAKHGIRLVIIDYLQLIEPDNRKAPRQEQVAAVSRRLKLLAKELMVPVVALAQLNRGTEDRAGHRPRMADLRESGSQEADADVVMLLHRAELYEGGESESGKMEIIVAKQRNGPIGDVTLTYVKEFMRLENYAAHVGF